MSQNVSEDDLGAATATTKSNDQQARFVVAINSCISKVKEKTEPHKLRVWLRLCK